MSRAEAGTQWGIPACPHPYIHPLSHPSSPSTTWARSVQCRLGLHHTDRSLILLSLVSRHTQCQFSTHAVCEPLTTATISWGKTRLRLGIQDSSGPISTLFLASPGTPPPQPFCERPLLCRLLLLNLRAFVRPRTPLQMLHPSLWLKAPPHQRPSAPRMAALHPDLSLHLVVIRAGQHRGQIMLVSWWLDRGHVARWSVRHSIPEKGELLAVWGEAGVRHRRLPGRGSILTGR